MTTEDLRAIAQRIVERMIREHPDVASEIAAQVLTELLAACLFNDDAAAVADFVQAINWKLGEIALHHGARRAWELVPCDTPIRQ